MVILAMMDGGILRFAAAQNGEAGLVDVELLDEILGDYIMDAWKEPKRRETIGAVRGGEDDASYFKYFEALARHLLRLKTQRTGARNH